MYSEPAALGMLVILFFVLIGLFFLLRGVVLWYFKINTMIDILTKQLDNQRQILEHLKGEPNEIT
jgi:hypothetical protein